jgi:hypothetical protein
LAPAAGRVFIHHATEQTPKLGERWNCFRWTFQISMCPWIGLKMASLREHLQENPIFNVKKSWFPVKIFL